MGEADTEDGVMEAVMAVGATPEVALNTEMSLRNQLYQVMEQVTWGGARQFSARLAPFGLTLQQYFTLVAIQQLNGCTMSALAARTHHSFGTMTGIIDRLVRQNFVERQSHPTDRRVVLVQLTEGGQEILAHIAAMREEQVDAVLATLGELQVHHLVRLVSQYMEVAGIADADAASAFS